MLVPTRGAFKMTRHSALATRVNACTPYIWQIQTTTLEVENITWKHNMINRF